MKRPTNYDELISKLNYQMRLKLHQNSHKPHWLSKSVEGLQQRLRQEVVELKLSLIDGDLDNARKECGDIANFCAFIIDKIDQIESEACNG